MILSRCITDDDFFKQIKAKETDTGGKEPLRGFALHIVSVQFQKTRPSTRNVYKLKLQSTLWMENKIEDNPLW